MESELRHTSGFLTKASADLAALTLVHTSTTSEAAELKVKAEELALALQAAEREAEGARGEAKEG